MKEPEEMNQPSKIDEFLEAGKKHREIRKRRSRIAYLRNKVDRAQAEINSLENEISALGGDPKEYYE